MATVDPAAAASQSAVTSFYDLISGDEDARVCRDIPAESCVDQPRNALAYLLANTLNKVADELSSARLVLPWMLAALGAPAALVGFLVPIRESGALLPQMAVAAYVRRMPTRKPVWLLGAALSALALFGIALVALWLDGAMAGWAVVMLLVVFSLSRGLCSVSAKDVLGKTVSKSRRGRVMGWSAGAGGVLTLVVGLGLSDLDSGIQGPHLYAALFFLAGVLWLLALLSFAAIRETPGAVEGGANALQVAFTNLRLLRDDRHFRSFVLGRVSLLAVALAAPFYVLLAQQQMGGSPGDLGLMVVASGLAAAVSAPLWGVMGDSSSRSVMAIAATGAGALGLGVGVAALLGVPWLSSLWFHAAVFMVFTVMHGGVRLGRKIYLVDMADERNRAAYVAISNTVIGVLMLLGGLIGLLVEWIGLGLVILLLGVWALLAAWQAASLPEVGHA